MTDRMTDRMTERMTDRMTDRMSDRMSYRTTSRTTGRTTGRMTTGTAGECKICRFQRLFSALQRLVALQRLQELPNGQMVIGCLYKWSRTHWWVIKTTTFNLDQPLRIKSFKISLFLHFHFSLWEKLYKPWASTFIHSPHTCISLSECLSETLESLEDQIRHLGVIVFERFSEENSCGCSSSSGKLEV